MFRDQERSTAKTADFAPVSKRHFLKTAAAIAAGAAFSRARAFAADKDQSGSDISARKPGPSRLSPRPTNSSSTKFARRPPQRIFVGGTNYEVELIARDDQSNPDRPPTSQSN